MFIKKALVGAVLVLSTNAHLKVCKMQKYSQAPLEAH